jgi:hypothetical protein
MKIMNERWVSALEPMYFFTALHEYEGWPVKYEDREHFTRKKTDIALIE